MLRSVCRNKNERGIRQWFDVNTKKIQRTKLLSKSEFKRKRNDDNKLLAKSIPSDKPTYGLIAVYLGGRRGSYSYYTHVTIRIGGYGRGWRRRRVR